MPTIKQTMPAGDLNYYRVIAAFWGFELSYPEPERALSELIENMCDFEHLNGVIEGLDEPALEALNELFNRGGKIPFTQFQRKFGGLREVGAGRRDRERYYDSPISTTEVLYYRGLIGKGFLKTGSDQIEQIFLPDEILEGMELLGYEPAEPVESESIQPPEKTNSNGLKEHQFPGRSATKEEFAWQAPRNADILNDLTTVICSVRNQQPFPTLAINQGEAEALLTGMGILLPDQSLDTDKVKKFLELPYEQTMGWLTKTWLESSLFDEMRFLEDIEVEGYLTNQPEKARAFLLEHIRKIPVGKWWNLNSFIKAIKEVEPDFQRPAGNYEVWMLKKRSSGQYLKGYRHWDDIEGKQIEYLITRPMRWMGMVEIGGLKEGSPPLAFRLMPSNLAATNEDGTMSVSNDGLIVASKDISRVLRYHVSRFCEPPKINRDSYIFKVTHASLSRAREQGLSVENLFALLRKSGVQTIAPLFQKALERWQENGIEAAFKNVLVLRVKKPSVIAELKKTSAARFIQEELNSTTVVIPKDAREKVRQALIAIGVLTEDGFIG